MLQPGVYNLNLRRGYTCRETMRLRSKLADGTLGDYIDLTGKIIVARIIDSDDETFTFAVTQADQTNPATKGQFTMLLTDVQTATLGPDNSKFYLDITETNGDKNPYLRGEVYSDE